MRRLSSWVTSYRRTGSERESNITTGHVRVTYRNNSLGGGHTLTLLSIVEMRTFSTSVLLRILLSSDERRSDETRWGAVRWNSWYEHSFNIKQMTITLPWQGSGICDKRFCLYIYLRAYVWKHTFKLHIFYACCLQAKQDDRRFSPGGVIYFRLSGWRAMFAHNRPGDLTQVGRKLKQIHQGGGRRHSAGAKSDVYDCLVLSARRIIRFPRQSSDWFAGWATAFGTRTGE